MGRALGGDLYVPHAIDVDGQTITVYDPVAHESLESRTKARTAALVTTAPRDRRWVRIRRPVVIVGGELTLEMLDLTFNPISKFHEAPLQLKANGGVFLVDDFGRQRMRPQDLLNRWIVPLESRRRLPDAAQRQEDRGAVRRPDRLRDEPRSAVARRRSVPPPHPLQDSGRGSDARSLRCRSSR